MSPSQFCEERAGLRSVAEQATLVRQGGKGLRVVTKLDLGSMARAGEREAQRRLPGPFKLADHDAIFKANTEERERMRAFRMKERCLAPAA